MAIVALLAGKFLGWVWPDPTMGIVGAVVIARWAWSLMKDTASVLLDKTDSHVTEEIRELLDQPGNLRITDLHVWRWELRHVQLSSACMAHQSSRPMTCEPH